MEGTKADLEVPVETIRGKVYTIGTFKESSPERLGYISLKLTNGEHEGVRPKDLIKVLTTYYLSRQGEIPGSLGSIAKNISSLKRIIKIKKQQNGNKT